MCPDPASEWDHCHAHGFVRGPLCKSCNVKELGAFASLNPESEAIIAYYSNCPECDQEAEGLR
jgi:hypothetical protein